MTERDRVAMMVDMLCGTMKSFVKDHRDDAEAVKYGNGVYAGVCFLAFALDAISETDFVIKCTDFRVFCEGVLIDNATD